MTIDQTAQFRATAGEAEALGPTPQEALRRLMRNIRSSAPMPIVIWPYNRGDAFFSDDQQARLQELKRRGSSLSKAERKELESLLAASFDATILRTQSLPPVKA